MEIIGPGISQALLCYQQNIVMVVKNSKFYFLGYLGINGLCGGNHPPLHTPLILNVI